MLGCTCAEKTYRDAGAMSRGHLKGRHHLDQQPGGFVARRLGRLCQGTLGGSGFSKGSIW